MQAIVAGKWHLVFLVLSFKLILPLTIFKPCTNLFQTLTLLASTRNKNINYSSLNSAIRPIAYSDENPDSCLQKLYIQMTLKNQTMMMRWYDFANENENNNDFEGLSEQMLFDQKELSDFIRDLSLSKDSSELSFKTKGEKF